MTAPASGPARPVQWAKVVDRTRCIGCHAASDTICARTRRTPCRGPASRVSPDGTRRLYWLLRPLKPAREAYRLPVPPERAPGVP